MSKYNRKNKLKPFQEAIKDCTAALAAPIITDEEKVMALMTRGSAKLKLRRSQEALEDFDAILKILGISEEAKEEILNHRRFVKEVLGRR